MKIYIAGKISGLDPIATAAKFAKAEQDIIAAGHLAINPVKEIQQYNEQIKLSGGVPLTDEKNRKEIMKICLSLLDCCNAIYLLHDWTASRGARFEFVYARMFDIKRFYL